MSGPAIAFDAVSKRFGRRQVLDGLTLEVAAGEYVALVGSNGAGKTTSIKALLDFQPIDAGRIRIFGADHRAPDARGRLVFLPERFVPPQHLRGAEFLDYMARLHGRREAGDVLARRAEALDLAHEALARPVHSYSKGMAQKLGLTACLDSGKELLVLDEPMSGLDPKARILVRRKLEALRARGHTVLFTTHSLSDVEALADRLAILHEGRIVFDGPRADCLRRFGASTLEDAYLACVDAPRPSGSGGKT